MALAHPLAFGALLKRERLARGLTQEALAERAGLSARGISDLERGIKHAPRKETLRLLVDALQLSPTERSRLEAAFHHSILAGVPPAPERRASSDRMHAPLAGRARELALLSQHLAGEGPPLLLLAGEPGMGKSRLLAEAAQRASAQGWTVLKGQCHRRSSQEPYAPLLEAVESHLFQQPPALQRLNLQSCSWLVRLLPELADTALVPTPAWTAAPEQERRLMFAAVARYLANIAGPAGTLLVLDDLHWAGTDALDLLASLLRSPHDHPVRFLGTYRSTEVIAPHPLLILLTDLTLAGLVAQEPVGSLSPQEARSLLRTLLGQEELPTPLQEQVLSRAGGVPFFLMSCAQALQAERAEGRPAEEVPWSVVESVRQRVALLPQVAQEVLGMAAIVGQRMPRLLLVAVARALGQSQKDAVLALEAASQAQLLLEEGEAAYQFAHDLIREAVLIELSAARRALLHQHVAEALEQVSGEPPVERLAYHYARAGIPEKAVVYLAQAGERAQTMYAHADAEGAYQEYVQSLDTLGWQVESARGREQLATVQVLRSRFQAALDVLEVALETYRRVRDAEGQRRVLAQVAKIYLLRGTPQQGLAHLVPQLADLRAGEATPGLVALEVGLASLSFGTGRYLEQLAAAERAVQLAQTMGEEWLLLRAYQVNSLALCMLERVEEALAALEAEQHLAERLGDLWHLVKALNNRAVILGENGDWTASLRALDQAVEAGEQLGDPTVFAQALSSRSVVYFALGDWQAARADAERALTVLGPIEQSWSRSGALWALGQLELAEGQEQAERRLEEALTLAQQSGDMEVQRGVQATLAESDLLLGRPESARARLQPLMDRPEHPEIGVAQMLPLLAWAAVDLGEDAQAAALLARSFERAGQHQRLAAVESYRIQARLYIRQQRWDEGQAALEEALSRCRAMPAPYAEAKALAVCGQLHQAKGEPALARERFAEARAICTRLGERLYAQQIGAELQAIKQPEMHS